MINRVVEFVIMDAGAVESARTHQGTPITTRYSNAGVEGYDVDNVSTFDTDHLVAARAYLANLSPGYYREDLTPCGVSLAGATPPIRVR